MITFESLLLSEIFYVKTNSKDLPFRRYNLG